MISFNVVKNWILAVAVVFTAGGSLLVAATPQIANASGDACNSGFLGFPAWYRGLTDKDCNIAPVDNISNFIWHVVLNLVEDAMMATGYVTVFFILYGGFKYLTSEGEPNSAAKARTTISNAVVGLIISLVAVGVVNYIVTGILK